MGRGDGRTRGLGAGFEPAGDPTLTGLPGPGTGLRPKPGISGLRPFPGPNSPGRSEGKPLPGTGGFTGFIRRGGFGLPPPERSPYLAPATGFWGGRLRLPASYIAVCRLWAAGLIILAVPPSFLLGLRGFSSGIG